MPADAPILMYHATESPRGPSIYDAFFSGVLLAFILHLFAGMVGYFLASGVEFLFETRIHGLFHLLVALPILVMFLLSLFIFLRDHWLGFLVGASLTVGSGLSWFLLQIR